MVNRQRFDKFALNTLTKVPNIPDYHLMVGCAEELSSVPLLVYNNASVPKEIASNIQSMSKLTNEQIAEAIANNEIEVNDLNGFTSILGV